MGADDYVVKPFSPRELIARVDAMKRRPRPSVLAESQDVISIGGLRINLDAVSLEVDGNAVELTRTEFDLLCALATRPKSALSRGQIIDAVWGSGWIGDHHVVDVHIGHLRRKLNDDAANPRFIRTIRGHGYAMGSG
jgi:DNA-binding response OmpR family regulator